MGIRYIKIVMKVVVKIKNHFIDIENYKKLSLGQLFILMLN